MRRRFEGIDRGELFGHAAGAFTGATREGRAGWFETANGGTLSLDEIGEMPLDLQPYILRVLEEEAIYRLGESKARPVSVRLVASTNRNLRSDVDEGRFRKIFIIALVPSRSLFRLCDLVSMISNSF